MIVEIEVDYNLVTASKNFASDFIFIFRKYQASKLLLL